MAAQATVGYYGKIPGRGDFISRRISREFTDFWDAWLQNGLSCSRTQLNDAWLNVYLTSPIWRFVLSPGMCGRQIWVGVVMPSVDKVGRYFPLTIVTPLAEELNPFNVAKLALNWFNRAETIALSTLEEKSFDFDVFDKQVEELSTFLPGFEGQGMGTESGYVNPRSSKGWRFPVESANAVDKSYSSLLWQLTNNRFSTYSIWWCDGSEHIEPSMLVSDGLPSVESYAAMLDGKWKQWSWDECPVQYLSNETDCEKPKIDLTEKDITLDIPEPSILTESAIIEPDLPHEPVEILDNWWEEEPDQLAKDAISSVANNLTDDTPESLLLMTEPADEDDSLAQTMLFENDTDAETSLLEDPSLAQTMLIGDYFHTDDIPPTENESLAQTVLVDAPDANDESLEKTQLIMGDEILNEQIDKTELFSKPNLNREVPAEESNKDPATKNDQSAAVLGALSSTNTIGLGDGSNEENNALDDNLEESASDKSFGENNYVHFDWTSTAYTHAGKVRKINEDAYLDYPKRGIWVVADGVGGHTSGSVASQLIVRQLLKVRKPNNLESFIEDVQNQLQYVNRYLLENVSNSQEYMVGSTVAVLLIYGKNAACVWAGDSRIYLNRNGVTSRITKDHSVVEEQADIMKRNEHVESLDPVNPNIITRAIGADDLLELDIEILDLLEDDAFLICSDGLYKEVSEDEIADYLNREDTQVISKGLLDLALERNARDNVTVISVMLAGS